MKDQDYIKIMDRISKNKIEEAFTWDASANKTRRSIRQLSLGIGAIAAAIAVVIGGISYNYRDRLHANPGDESSDAQRNLLGGHGEIKGFVGTDGNMLFRDDNNYYLPIGYSSDGSEGVSSTNSLDYLKWSINGSTGTERHTFDGRLLTDGEQLYTCHDHELFTVDSYGDETFFSAVPWQPCTIRKLCEGWYFLSAFVEDSWIDGEPKPNVILNLNGSPLNQFVDYGNVCSDGKNVYYSDFSNQTYAAPLNDIQNASIVADLTMREDYKQAPQWPEQELQEWLVKDDCIYSLHSSPAASGPVSLMCTPLHGDSDSRESSILTESYPTSSDQFLKNHLLNDRMYQFSVKYQNGFTGLSVSDLAVTEETDYFVVESESLWETDPTGEMSDFILFDTGEHIIFTLPKDGKNGEQIVQVNKETGEYQYFGENYVPQETEPADITNDASDRNALGGRGKIRSFQVLYTNETGIAEDDEYIYDYSRGRRARKTGGDTVFEPLNLPQIPQYNPDSEQMPNLFITDGMVLLAHDGTLFEVHPDGTQTALWDLTADSAGNPLTDLTIFQLSGFAPDASGRPGKLFLNGTVQNHNLGGAILDLNTGTFVKLTTDEYAPYDFKVTEDAVYAIDDYFSDEQNQYIGGLVRYDDAGKAVPVSTPEWGIPNILEANIESDGTIWFRNQRDEPLKGNVKDHSVTTVSEEEFSRHHSNIPGTACDVWLDDETHQMIFRNDEESGEQILKDFSGVPDLDIVFRGTYVENGVIHLIVAEMLTPASESQMPGEIDHVITIDGDNVSSYAITAP